MTSDDIEDSESQLSWFRVWATLSFYKSGNADEEPHSRTLQPRALPAVRLIPSVTFSADSSLSLVLVTQLLTPNLSDLPLSKTRFPAFPIHSSVVILSLINASTSPPDLSSSRNLQIVCKPPPPDCHIQIPNKFEAISNSWVSHLFSERKPEMRCGISRK